MFMAAKGGSQKTGVFAMNMKLERLTGSDGVEQAADSRVQPDDLSLVAACIGLLYSKP
jgi:hypothetical protein